MMRPTRFEESRYLGDKRTQRCYDLDAARTPELDAEIDELVASEQYAAFDAKTTQFRANFG